MPQILRQQVKNQFNKGLITEAGELTFPEGASIDEDNCELRRDGSRKRREGISFETSAVDSSFTVSDTDTVSVGTWYNVNGIPEKELTVVQISSDLYFYDKQEIPYSATQIKNFGLVAPEPAFSSASTNSIPMLSFDYAGRGDLAEESCTFESIGGMLIVANPNTETVAITAEIDSSSGSDVWTFTVEIIEFRTRDFKRLSDLDTFENEIPEADITPERLYDTRNAGWVGVGQGNAALNEYLTDRGAYPPLTLPWFSGKASNGTFDTSEFRLIQAGSSVVGNGHVIFNFFKRNRNRITTGLPDNFAFEFISDRFSTIATLGNRVFYSGLNKGGHEESNVVLVSRVIDGATANSVVDTSGLGECLQRNDPTSEDFSDLLDDDGVVIRISEAYGIRKLHNFNNSIFVFAENGIWQIKGVDDVFRASGFAVNKISAVGLFNKDSFVSADGVPFWWSDVGIHTLGVDERTFQPSEQNISISTIQTRFDTYTEDQRNSCKGVFDPINKRVYWMFPGVNESVVCKLSKILILDIPLQAFIPWSISDASGTSPILLGATYYRGLGTDTDSFNVVDMSSNQVIDSSSDTVITFAQNKIDTGEPALVFLVRNTNNTMTFATFNDSSFLDWGSADYSSFAEGGYDFSGDLLRKKNAPYIGVYCKVTETGWTGDETNGYELVRPSSLTLKSFFEFKTSPSSTQQAYRLKPLPVVDPLNLDSLGFDRDVIMTRLKIRGRGTSMRLRFESEQGKDFHLLGWGELNAINQRP